MPGPVKLKISNGQSQYRLNLVLKLSVYTGAIINQCSCVFHYNKETSSGADEILSARVPTSGARFPVETGQALRSGIVALN